MRSLLGKIVMFLVNTSRHVISLSLSLYSRNYLFNHITITIIKKYIYIKEGKNVIILKTLFTIKKYDVVKIINGCINKEKELRLKKKTFFLLISNGGIFLQIFILIIDTFYSKNVLMIKLMLLFLRRLRLFYDDIIDYFMNNYILS